MKKIFYGILTLSLLLPSYKGVTAQSKPVEKKDVIIMFKKTSSSRVVQNVGGVVEDKYKNIPAISASVPETSLSSLKKNPNVAYVEIDKPIKPSSQTIDWGHYNTKTDIANNSGFTGKGVKVAVLDTGVKISHTDLLLSGGYNPTGASYDDSFGHGTHVAGIIGAKDNDFGVVGVAPDSEIYAVKVMNNSDGSGSISDIIQGIDWSISNHMNVINMSLGSDSYSQAFQDAVNRAHDAGVLVVAAAGNDGNATGTGDTVDYPGAFDNVVAIAATDSQNNKASFSSAGPAVDFAAPGYNIYSTYYNGGYTTMSGTSMATPYFTGVFALYKEAYPNYTNDQIITLMQTNAIDLGTAGKDNLFGYGLVQAPLQGDASVPSVSIPSIPSGFVATDVLANSISLSWDVDSNAKIYDLKRNGTLIYSGTAHSFTDKNLLANTTYQYELVAKNIAGKSSPATLSVKTKSISLSTPTLKATKVSNGYNFTWNKVTYAANYKLYKNDALIYNGPLLTFFEDKANFVPGNLYTYSLIAENSTALSKTYVLKLTVSPDAVSNLTETHTSSSVKLTWNASQGATYYQVKINGAIVYKGTATTYTYNSLLSGKSYVITVEAGNAGGLSPASTVSFTTAQTIPAAPTTLTITGSATTANLKWGSIYNAASYHVYRDGVLIKDTTLLTFADSGLTPGQTYTYTVTAVNIVGEGAGKTLKFTTTPTSPSYLNATGGQNKVSLSWNSVPGATYYMVKKNGSVVYKGPNTSFENINLPNDTSYTYTVQAGNTTGISATYASATAKTLPAITTAISIGTNASYNAGDTVTIGISLKDVYGNSLSNQTLSIKITYPNGTYKTYSYKTDYNGNINLLMYTNYYTLRGTYKIDVTKSYLVTGAYSAASASKSFSLN